MILKLLRISYIRKYFSYIFFVRIVLNPRFERVLLIIYYVDFLFVYSFVIATNSVDAYIFYKNNNNPKTCTRHVVHHHIVHVYTVHVVYVILRLFHCQSQRMMVRSSGLIFDSDYCSIVRCSWCYLVNRIKGIFMSDGNVHNFFFYERVIYEKRIF